MDEESWPRSDNTVSASIRCDHHIFEHVQYDVEHIVVGMS